MERIRRFLARWWALVTFPISFGAGMLLSWAGVPTWFFIGLAIAVTAGILLWWNHQQRKFRQQLMQMAVDAAEEILRRERP